MGERTMREKIKLSREGGVELFYNGEFGSFVMVDDNYETTGRGRWSIKKNALVRDLSDDSVYLLPYSVGATESQDEGLFEYMDAVLIPAESVVVQRWAPEKANL